MREHRSYLRYTWFVFFMVFLVILAGGVVRMTQSGMGCPDWPKCFGRWIPPTSADQLPPDFEKYLSKQDIDHSFNVYHTWIEYINRLLGALLGIFIIIHTIISIKKFRKTNKRIIIYSVLLLITVALQGWLGKRVVDENLETAKVTLHMIVALGIAAIPLVIIYTLTEHDRVKDNFIRNFSVAVLIIILTQVILGTQIREQIDVISKSYKYVQREYWIGNLDNLFLVHRSFSWVVALTCLVLGWSAWKYTTLRKLSLLVFTLVLFTIIAGVIMMWYHIPAIAQPLHLLLACFLFTSVLAMRLKCI